MPEHHKHRHLAMAPSAPPAPEGEAAPGTAIDPVCGMKVSTDSPLRTEHAGQTYYFCNPRCLARFQADPGAFLSGPKGMDAAPPPPASQDPGKGAAAGSWTCPMHPEIVRDGPGS